MALLSQALHLGYLLSPHSAFQGHAAHTARWPAMLSSNGSSDTGIADGVFHIPMPCFHGAIPVYPKVVTTFLYNASRRTRRAMHASCESPWHSLAKRTRLGGCRLRSRDCSRLLASELDVKVSLHPAQASQRPYERPVS